MSYETLLNIADIQSLDHKCLYNQGGVVCSTVWKKTPNFHKTDSDSYLCTVSNILESTQFTKEIIGCGPTSLVYQETSSKAGSLSRWHHDIKTASLWAIQN